ncbi:hypothetical protein JCM14202_537 [Agrilactobacillus composti DSM 18527 = JCM 14202]|uniref:hypothetical protein n=1 Tax=Agrilactobacillus composti TaxID=398555 RepID=UPI00042E1653|nr:hypothetical protein [Agrilactobacillus composti]GAF38712.1 hypothetical protein JCM14202_537 [Agrilactobacillus composti DSM 18527 = JCM 14202]
MGSTDLADYQDFHIPSSIQYLQDPEYIQAWHLPPYYFYALIQAFHEKNITIVGENNSGFDGRDLWDTRGEEGFRAHGCYFIWLSKGDLKGLPVQK